MPLTDRNGRRSSRHGLLELPRASLEFGTIDYPLIYRFSECRWADSCWSTFLEPGLLHPYIPRSRFWIGILTVPNKVDDNGESSWIFESRDVRNHLSLSSLLRAERPPLSLHGLPIQWTLGECPIPRLFIRELKPLQDCFGLRYTSSQPSGLVSFSSPYSSSTYRPWNKSPSVLSKI